MAPSIKSLMPAVCTSTSLAALLVAQRGYAIMDDCDASQSMQPRFTHALRIGHMAVFADQGWISLSVDAGVDQSLLMEQRREADPAGAPRPEALHVYGVDLVGTRDLLTFFSVYGPTYVEWIDDSSCNVLFPDEFTVKRLLVQTGEALSAEDIDKVEGVQASHTVSVRVETVRPVVCCPRCIVCGACLKSHCEADVMWSPD